MRRRPPALLPWLAGLLAIYLVAPFAAGLGQLGLADWHSADWSALGRASAVSVVSATLATMIVSLTGIPLGYLLARVPGRAMALLGFLVQLPLALPPLSSGILLLFLLGYTSPLGRLAGGALTDSLTGIVLAESFVAAPFLIIAARSAFAGMDPVLEDVAATLGHRSWGVFLRVSLPLAWRAILAGMLLAWLRAFGEFGATVMVAYHPYSLPVYTYVAFGSEGLPAMLPVLLPTLLAALAVMAVATLVATARPARPPSPRRLAVPEVPPAPPATLPPPRRPIDFAYRRQLDGFTLDVAWRTDARRLAILGESGSGKSMTLRLLAGLDLVPDGRLMLDGCDLSAAPPERRGIAYVPQTYGLFPHLTVARQLAFAVDGDAGLARRWTARLGLAGLEHRLPAALSLGQQQRVALARAFSRPTRLLLLDEPFSALDAPLRARLRRELRALQEEIDATTILVTHDPEEAFLLAEDIMVLQAGRVLQAGPAAAVHARPASETVARLLGADNVCAGRTAGPHAIDVGRGIRLAVADPPLPPGLRFGWSVRPEAVQVCRDGCHAATIIGIGPATPGRCEAVLQLGTCHLRAILATPHPLGSCRVSISPAAVQVWPVR